MGYRWQMGERSAGMLRGWGVLVLIRQGKSTDLRSGRHQGWTCFHQCFPRHGCRICSVKESSCCHSKIHSYCPGSSLNHSRWCQWLQMYLRQLESPTAFKFMSLQTLGHIITCNTNRHSQDFSTSISVISESSDFLGFLTRILLELTHLPLTDRACIDRACWCFSMVEGNYVIL